MDSQQRNILEVIYECMESAGYSISQLRGSSTGVFVGQMSDDYREMILRDVDCHPQYTATGSSRSILANCVSYIFDWKGPSLNIDTACSSSLAALHLAIQSLRSGESDMAVVAGVNLVFNPEMFSFLSSVSVSATLPASCSSTNIIKASHDITIRAMSHVGCESRRIWSWRRICCRCYQDVE